MKTRVLRSAIIALLMLLPVVSQAQGGSYAMQMNGTSSTYAEARHSAIPDITSNHHAGTFRDIINTKGSVQGVSQGVPQPAFAGPLLTFGSEINLSNNVTFSYDPEMASSGNNVYVVWADNGDILFRLSADNGKTWQPVQNVSNTSSASILPELATSGSYVHVVWRESFPEGNEIAYRRITDNGGSLVFDPPLDQPPVNLSNRPLNSSDPRIAASGNCVYVAWYDEFDAYSGGPPPGFLGAEVLFKASKDNGQSFLSSPSSPPSNLSQSAPGSVEPEIAAAGNSVYVTWRERPGGDSEIYFMASADNGDSFNGSEVSYRSGAYINPSTSSINLSNTPGEGAPIISFVAKIATAGNNVYVVWQEGTGAGGANTEILFRASNDNGASFIPPLSQPAANVSSNTGKSLFPRVAAAGTSVYTFWRDETSPVGLLFRSSQNSGATFGSTLSILSGELPNELALSASGNNVYAGWIGDASPFAIGSVVRGSIDNGATFDSPTRASSSGGGRVNLRVGAAPGGVYVLWQLGVSGNAEVVFASGNLATACPSGLAISGSVPSFCQEKSQPVNISLTGSNLSGATVTWSLAGPTPNPNLGTGTTLNTTLSGLQSGNYSITATATQTGCTAASASTNFTVFASPAVTISGAPAGAICMGTFINLMANVAGGSGPFNYHWTRNGTPFAGNSETVSDNPRAGSTTYGVEVTSSNGCASAARVTVNVFDFTVAVFSPPNAIRRGSPASQTFTVTVSAVDGSAGAAGQPISINTTGDLPAGVLVTGLPTTLTLGSNPSSTFTVTTGQMTPLGDLQFTVRGTSSVESGSGSRTANAILHIFDLTTDASPRGQTVLRGSSTSYAFTATLMPGSTEVGLPMLNHTVAGLPGDATGTFSPNPVQLVSPTTAFTMNVQTGQNSTGDFPLTITGTNVTAGVSLSGSVFLRILSPPSVYISGPTEVCQFDPVTLTANPSGGTPPYNYSWSTGASTQSISPSTASTGSFPFTVTITDANGETATATATLMVNPKPSFSQVTPTGQGAHLCSPRLMNVEDPVAANNIQNWFIQANNSGTLVIRVYAVAVNPTGESGTVTFTVYDPSNAFTGTTTITFPTGPSYSGGAENSSVITVSPSVALGIYRMQVTLGDPTVAGTHIAHHYRFEVEGGVQAAVCSPSISDFEADPARWGLNVNPGEALIVQLFGGNTTGVSQAMLRLYDPSRAVYFTDATPQPVPRTINVPSAATGQWILEVTIDGHYRLDKQSGSDRGIYLTRLVDMIPPTVFTWNITVRLDQSGSVTVPASAINNGTSDNCHLGVLLIDGAPSKTFTCANIGPNNVILTAKDDGGNSANGTAVVTVVDNIVPSIMVQPPVVNVATGPDASTCGILLTDTQLGTVTASDNCDVVVTRTGVPPNNFFPVGTTTITYTATDPSGNKGTATQTVTVIENTPPTITPPADVTIQTGPGAATCSVTISDATLGTAIASDNCSAVTISRNGVPTDNLFPVGTTTITYTATDASGNTATSTQKVTVVDNTAPTISCPANIVVSETPGQGSAIVTYPAPTVSDNCAIASTVCTPPSGSTFPVGITSVTCTTTDVNGNSSSCSFTVTVSRAACYTLVTVEGNFVRKGSNVAKKVPISGARVIMLPKTPVQAKCNLLDAQCVWSNLSQVNVAGDAVQTTGADGTVMAYSSVADPTGWAIYIDLHGAVPVGADAGAINQGTEQIAVANTDCAPNKRFTTILVADGSSTVAMTSRQQQFKGSLLEITYPDSVVWDGIAFSYPLIFTSDSEWEVDICGDVPQGYRIISDKCVQLFVADETKVVFFDVIDLQSPEPNLKLRGHVKHNGKTKEFDANVPGRRKAKGHASSSRISETAIETELVAASYIPTTYALHDAYPNPFNPSTTIRYDIPQGDYVRLKVYDVRGKEVAVLVDDYREAGQYAVQFNGGGLPSGVYLYQIMTGKFAQAKRFVLVK